MSRKSPVPDLSRILHCYMCISHPFSKCLAGCSFFPLTSSTAEEHLSVKKYKIYKETHCVPYCINMTLRFCTIRQNNLNKKITPNWFCILFSSSHHYACSCYLLLSHALSTTQRLNILNFIVDTKCQVNHSNDYSLLRFIENYIIIALDVCGLHVFIYLRPPRLLQRQ